MLPSFEAGSVWLVGAGPGDPGLLTIHALYALEHADVVLHDALVASEILALITPVARVESVGKRAGRPSARQIRINERLIAFARANLKVVRLKGGDPMVFGRGGEEALALAAAGISFRVVPGISAGIGGMACAGLPITHRGIARSVAFVTGQATVGGEPDWTALAHSADTIVLYMGCGRIGDIAAHLIGAGRDPSEPLVFITDATTSRQRVRAACLNTAAEAAVGISAGATLIVIGEIVRLRAALEPWLEWIPASVVPAQLALARV
ncbi:MAG: uroporphyrinogen-III C-methyltransferase [Casimicrobiaceae bacterium]